MGPTPSQTKANQSACDPEIDDLMDAIKDEGQQQAGAGVLDISVLRPMRRTIPNNRLGNSV